MQTQAHVLGWARGCYERSQGDIPGVYTARYRLRDLIDGGFIDAAAARNFLDASGLVDFVWQMTWADDYETPSAALEDRFSEGQGYVVFIHGWTGNHTIWEGLPSLVVSSDRRLVSLAVDHNGFCSSLLLDDTPPLENCNPPAALRTV